MHLYTQDPKAAILNRYFVVGERISLVFVDTVVIYWHGFVTRIAIISAICADDSTEI